MSQELLEVSDFFSQNQDKKQQNKVLLLQRLIAQRERRRQYETLVSKVLTQVSLQHSAVILSLNLDRRAGKFVGKLGSSGYFAALR